MTLPYIMVAPNGARRTTADHPALPMTTGDILDTARACFDAGARGLHLHVRDADGGHSLDAGRYIEVIDEMAHLCPEMAVQITTEAAGIYDVRAQLAVLEAVKPTWASISVREIARAPDLATRLYATCADQDTKVQHILYGADDIALLQHWHAAGIVESDQDAVLFVLGRYADGQRSVPRDLAPFRAAMPKVSDWMVCAFGPHEHDCLAAAAAQGGALRVGFENSLTNAIDTPHADNVASVAALVSRLERTPE